jgi:hypothetical protein
MRAVLRERLYVIYLECPTGSTALARVRIYEFTLPTCALPEFLLIRRWNMRPMLHSLALDFTFVRAGKS